MFEHHREPLLPKEVFLQRVWRHLGIAVAIICGCLGLGILGYHFCERLSWLDSLLNASMILSGMGPVNPIHHTAGKLFASHGDCIYLRVGKFFVSWPGARRYFDSGLVGIVV